MISARLPGLIVVALTLMMLLALRAQREMRRAKEARCKAT